MGMPGAPGGAPPSITGGDTSAKGGTSGAATSGTGNKTLNFGGNPNIQTALQNPALLIAAIIAAFLVWKTLRK